MTETKDFPALAVLQVVTGRVLETGGFRAVHECAEWVVGHSIWTHEFADPTLVEQLHDAIVLQVPELRGARDDARATVRDKETARVFGERWTAKLPAHLTLRKGSCERKVSPVDTAAKMMGDR